MPDVGISLAAKQTPEQLLGLALAKRSAADHAGALAIYAEIRGNHPDGLAPYIGEVQVLRDLGRTEEAEALLVETVARFPAELAPVIERARSAQQRGDMAEAGRRWANVRIRAPGHVAGYAGAAAILREQGRYAEAEAVLRDAMARFPDDVGAAMDYAWIAHRKGNWEEALRRWDDAHARFPQHLTGLTVGAVALRELHRYEEADARLKEAIRRWPNERGPTVEYAWIPCARRDWPEALRRWELVRDQFPEVPESHLRVAMILVDLWRFDDAERVFTEGMQRFPRYADFAIEYARLAYRHNQYDEAGQRFARVREQFPNESAGWIGGAQVLKHLFKLSEADRLLEDAIRRIPGDPAILIEYARVPIAPVVKAERNWEAALARLRMLRDRFPGCQRGLMAAIQILCEGEQLDDAEAWASDAVKRLENDPQLAVAHGNVARERGDWTEATRRFERALERFPGNPNVIAGLGGALTGVGRFDEADRLLEEAIAKFPYHSNLLSEYAQVAARRDDWDRALTRWTNAQQRFPDENHFAHRVFEARLRLADLELARGSVGYQPPADTAPNPPTRQSDDERSRTRQMLLHFESLGGRGLGCEFGIFQRDYGAEPLGLLRWADMPPDKLVEVLRTRFAGVGDPDNTMLFVDREHGRPEYCTQDKRGMMFMRAFIYEDDMPYDRMWSQALRRLKFLRGKLIGDLEAGDKVFVYRITARNLTPDEIDGIWHAVRSYGDSTLLYVRYEDEEHPNGTVEMVKPGLMIGYIDRFKQLPNGDLTAAPPGKSWAEICRKAYTLWSAGEIASGRTVSQASPRVEASKEALPSVGAEGVLSHLQFGRGGNADAYLGRGWSSGEDGFRWMVDDVSEFWMGAAASGPYTMTLDLHPNTEKTAHPAQRVTISVGGTDLYRADLSGPVTCDITIPETVPLSGGRIHIVIQHPDAISPQALTGASDVRHLALAIREARLRRATDPTIGVTLSREALAQ